MFSVNILTLNYWNFHDWHCVSLNCCGVQPLLCHQSSSRMVDQWIRIILLPYFTLWWFGLSSLDPAFTIRHFILSPTFVRCLNFLIPHPTFFFSVELQAAGVFHVVLFSYSASLLDLMRSMLSVDPASRPDIFEVISRLQQILSESFSGSLESRVCWLCLSSDCNQFVWME